MEKCYLIPTIAVFLICCTNGLQAQTTQTKFDQTELMKQWIGSWKVVYNDTTAFFDFSVYGTGLEGYYRYVTKGKIIMEGKQLYGYVKIYDKYIVAEIIRGHDLPSWATNDMTLWVTWFKSKNKYEWIPYDNISNPEKASFKYEGEFKTPDLAVETMFINGKPVETDTWTRVK
jgi:sRNA-binding regulator protein Hfq